jgi:hypothetical protein
MKKIQIIVVIAFISIFILMMHLLADIPSEALYIIYLLGGIGLVYFLRSVYLYHGKRTYIFYLLAFVFMVLNMISLFVLKKDAIAIGIAFSIVSLIFLALGMIENIEGNREGVMGKNKGVKSLLGSLAM